MYFVQSPYTPGTDAGMTFSNFSAQFISATSIIDPAHGGTGVNNGLSTITIGGNVSFVGAFTFAGTLTGNTAVTFPTSGTLATTSQLPTPSALTEVNDTNVTMTLGGSPTVALLAPTSMTLGWSGQLSVPRGGTGAATFTAFSVICAGTTATGNFQNVSGVGTLGQILTSQGAGSLPQWAAPATSGTVTSISAGTGITLTPNPIVATGSVALTVPVTAILGGTNQTTYTLGDILYSSATNTLSKLAGNITAVKQYLSQTGTGAVSAAPVWATIAGADITGAALTKVDDTNVTMTLGGTPATALLRAASLTLGWTGQLSLARGGTNANLTASNGGIFYSTGTAGAILAGTATAGQILISGASTTPSWLAAGGGGTLVRSAGTAWAASTTTLANSFGVSQLVYAATANNLSGLTTANNGTLITSATGVPSWLANGTTGQVLTATTGAPPSWAAPASAATSVIVDDTTTNATMYPTWVTANSGSLPLKVSSTKLSFNPSTGTMALGGSLSSSTGITSSVGLNLITHSYTALAVNFIDVANGVTGTGPQILATGSDASVAFRLAAKGGSFQIYDSLSTTAAKLSFFNSAVTFATTLKAGANTSNVTFILPIVDGLANFIMKTDGGGNLSLTNGGQVSGTATNDSASSGNIGEFVSAEETTGVAMTTITSRNITSISLTAGDWDVMGHVSLEASGSVITQAYSWISSTSATPPNLYLTSLVTIIATSPYTNYSAPAPFKRFSLSGTTTIYLSAQCTFGSGTVNGGGGIYARRRR